MNLASLLLFFIMDTFIKKFGESISTYDENPGPDYEDTKELYSVGSLKTANNDSSFIKIAFVIDQAFYNNTEQNCRTVSWYCQNILTMVNLIFQPFNIFVALVDIIIWASKDEIEMDHNFQVTCKRFENYAGKLMQNNNSIDYMQLLTMQKFEMFKEERDAFYQTSFQQMDKMLCKAAAGGLHVHGLDNDYLSTVLAVELTLILAYKMGINTTHKNCNKEPIELHLFRYLNSARNELNSCAVNLMNQTDTKRIDFSCLNVKPDILYKNSICGNNVTEPGEECDCGPWEHKCHNPCCNSSTCLRKERNSCAFGECCDLKSCALKKGEICRPVFQPCDVEESCDGESAFCLKDKLESSGQKCSIKICQNESIGIGIKTCQATMKYEGICDSEGRCQHGKSIFFPLDQKCVLIKPTCSDGTEAICDDNTANIICDSKKISTKCYCPNTHCQTYLYIIIIAVLLIATILFWLAIYIVIIKKCCFYKQFQCVTNNLFLRRRIKNEENQYATHSFIQMDLLDNENHESENSDTVSNIYEEPLHIYQQCQSTSSDNFENTNAPSGHSKTGSGIAMSTSTNSDDQCDTDENATVTTAEQRAPEYLENLDRSYKVDPIHNDSSYNKSHQPHKMISSSDGKYTNVDKRQSTTSSGYMIPTPTRYCDSQNVNPTTITVPDQLAPGYVKLASTCSSTFNSQLVAAPLHARTDPLNAQSGRSESEPTRNRSRFKKLFCFMRR